MRKLILISSIVMILITGTSALAQKKKGKEPELKDWRGYDFTKHFTYKNGGGKKDFVANKRIFVSNFQISQKIVANGTQTGSSSFAKMTVGLTPIDVNVYQRLTDKLYTQFIDHLKAEGYEIVSDEEVANSSFAKEEHNGKTVLCQYTKEPYYDRDQFKNEMVYLWPKNKFIVVNYKTIPGTWPTRFSKAINANVLNVNLIVDAVGFDGSRRTGYKGGASIEAGPSLSIFPFCSASNSRGGMAVWGTALWGNNNWVGPDGMYKTESSTTVFGSVKGSYTIDVNEGAYLAEVEALTSGLSKGFINSLMAEVK